MLYINSEFRTKLRTSIRDLVLSVDNPFAKAY